MDSDGTRLIILIFKYFCYCFFNMEMKKTDPVFSLNNKS